ncbi:MAG: hypothetical protein WCP28_01150 [Actinomycetes bacterium]
MSSDESVEAERPAPAELRATEVAFVDTTLRVVALIWVGLGLLSLVVFALLDAGQFSDAFNGSQILVLLCIATALVVMVFSLALHRIGTGWVVVAMMVTATLSILACKPVVDGEAFPLSVQWATTAAFSAALLLPNPAAWRTIVGFTVAANLLIAVRLLLVGQASLLVEPVISTVDAIGIAMGALAAVTVWRRIAQDRDRATVDAALATANAEITRERSDYLKQLNYGLHDTVINTLGAVRAGVPASVVGSVPARARDDLRQMSARIDGYDPDADELSVRDLITIAGTQAERLHLDADIGPLVSDDGGPGPVVPQRVLRGMRDCINEALLNISKHAPGATATVRVTRVGSALITTVSDSGPGIPTGPTVPTTLLQRATHSGIRATATGARGPGAAVELSWSPELTAAAAAERAASGPASISRSLTSMAVRIAAWVGGSYLVTTALAAASNAEPAELAPMVLGGLLIAAAAIVSRRQLPLPGLMMVVLMISVPAILSLSMANDDLCGVSGTTFPPSSWAALVALVTILLSGAPWQGLTAAAVYVVSNTTLVFIAIATTSCGPAYTANFITDCAGLLAIGLFRRRIDRYFSEAAITARLTATAQTEIAALQQLSAASSRRSDIMLTDSRELLERLADGTADPLDPAVREAAGTQESYLRSILRIDPDLGPLAEELVAVVGRAAKEQVRADITVLSTRWPDEQPPDLSTVASVGRALSLLAESCPPGGQLRITVDASSTDWLTVVADGHDLTAEQAALATGQIEVPTDITNLNDQTLVEFRRRIHQPLLQTGPHGVEVHPPRRAAL